MGLQSEGKRQRGGWGRGGRRRLKGEFSVRPMSIQEHSSKITETK